VVAGKWIVEDGQILGLDLEQLKRNTTGKLNACRKSDINCL